MSDNNLDPNHEENPHDAAILRQLEKQFTKLRYGGATGKVPPTPTAVSIGDDMQARSDASKTGLVIPNNSRPTRPQMAPASSANLELGDICLFSTGEIGIFQQASPGVPYGIFLMLQAGRTIETRGVLLDADKPVAIGQVPQNVMSSMLASQVWDHDYIVYSLKSVEFISYLRTLEGNAVMGGAVAPVSTPAVVAPKVAAPQIARPIQVPFKEQPFGSPRAPKPLGKDEAHLSQNQAQNVSFGAPRAPMPLTEDAQTQPTAAPPQSWHDSNDDERLVKGRQIIISHSKIHTWKSVYMGDDEKGQVMAFKTMNGWELTRVTLSDYTNLLTYGDVLPPAKVAAIEAEIISSS